MEKIIIHEVGMRDGLQAEEAVVPTEQKINWIKKLAETGVDIIQVGSFVNPKRMPQMADTDELFGYFSMQENKLPKVTLSGLVLNEKGLERGMACGVEMFCMGVSASETHSHKNTGMTTADATIRIIDMAKSASASGKKVQLSVHVRVAADLSGRPYLVYNVKVARERVGELESDLIEEFWKAFVTHARLNLHIELLYGRNAHHIFEAVFKAAARALCLATRIDGRVQGVPSTKGVI